MARETSDSSFHFCAVQAPQELPEWRRLWGEIEFSRVYNPEAKRLLVAIFHTQYQLAMIITDVVAIAFSSYNRPCPRLSANSLNRSLLGIKGLRKRHNDWKDETQSLLFGKDLSQHESIQVTTKLIWLHYQ